MRPQKWRANREPRSPGGRSDSHPLHWSWMSCDLGRGLMAVLRIRSASLLPWAGSGGEAPRVPCRKAGSWDVMPRCPQIAPFSLRASFLFFFLSPSHLLTPPPCTRAPPTHTHQAKVKDVCSGGAVPRTSCSEVRDKLEGPQSGSAPLSPARSEIGTKDSQLGFAPHTLQPCKTETALGVPS